MSTSSSQFATTVSSILSSYTNASSLTSALPPVSSIRPPMSDASPSSMSSTPGAQVGAAKSALVGLDMMPTIPLVPVQVPSGRGVVTIPRSRGRHRGFPFLSGHSKPGFQVRRGLKMKRLGGL